MLSNKSQLSRAANYNKKRKYKKELIYLLQINSSPWKSLRNFIYMQESVGWGEGGLSYLAVIHDVKQFGL